MATRSSITMKDIARELGVSQTTVSFTLKGKADLFGISQETQQRIRTYVERMGYVPDVDAANVAGGHVRRVGLVITNSMTENDKAIFFKLLQTLPEKGASPLLYSVTRDTFVDGIRYLVGKKAGDLLLIGSAFEHLARFPKAHSMLTDKRIYLIDYPFPELKDLDLPLEHVVKVGIDRAQSYRAALTMLGNLGHKRIGAMTHGYQYLKDISGTSGNPELLHITGEQLHGEDYFAMGYQILPEIVKLMEDEGMTAAMVGDDQLAIGLISALLETGHKVPRDLSILGFDNIAIGAYARVPLTTIDVPVNEIANVILSDLFTEQDRRNRHVLSGKVVLRESVGVAPEKG